LEELGIKNYVVQPQDCDERGKGVKNDRLDAAALCQRLDRYERGNKKAFSTVRIPTVDEERERAMSRQRQQLMRERQCIAGMGLAFRFLGHARKGHRFRGGHTNELGEATNTSESESTPKGTDQTQITSAGNRGF
jgi:transposase